MLTSFEARQFGAFSDLRLERLGRVNLIVGRNNVGKTMLLEALRLYLSRGHPAVIRDLLLGRDEVLISPDEAEDETYLRIEALFHGRQISNGDASEIQLGPLDDPKAELRIAVRPFRTVLDPVHPGIISHPIDISLTEGNLETTPVLFLSAGGEAQSPIPLAYFTQLRPTILARGPRMPARPAFVPARNLESRETARWWDSIVLRDAEERVINFLRIIAPVERLSLIQHPWRRGERMVMLKLADQPAPVPLKSMGEGIFRIFQIALALEWARESGAASTGDSGQVSLFPESPEMLPPADRTLLVDEVENGIHYSALPELWKFIFTVAETHDVQVFATTHSWDCVEGFQAATASSDTEALLLRLQAKAGQTRAVLFNKEELAVATREDIEIR